MLLCCNYRKLYLIYPRFSYFRANLSDFRLRAVLPELALDEHAGQDQERRLRVARVGGKGRAGGGAVAPRVQLHDALPVQTEKGARAPRQRHHHLLRA